MSASGMQKPTPPVRSEWAGRAIPPENSTRSSLSISNSMNYRMAAEADFGDIEFRVQR